LTRARCVDTAGDQAWVARAQLPLSETLLFVSADFVVGNGNALATTAILPVQAHDGVSGRAGAGEEVQNGGVCLGAQEHAEYVLNQK